VVETALPFLKHSLVTLFYHARVLGTMGDANAIPHDVFVASIHQACFLFVVVSHLNAFLLGCVVTVRIHIPCANVMKMRKAIAIFHCFSFASIGRAEKI
jgi:hypothetical protein